MRRALWLLPLLLVAACSDSSSTSTDTSAPQTGYTAPAAPAGMPSAPPLTQADIDRYCDLSVAFYKAPKNRAGQQSVLEKFGMTDGDWGKLYMRVKEARDSLGRFEKINEAVPPHLASDVELVKANRKKIELALQGKAE